MEGYADRVDESVAPMVPDDRVNAEEEFRPSVTEIAGIRDLSPKNSKEYLLTVRS